MTLEAWPKALGKFTGHLILCLSERSEVIFGALNTPQEMPSWLVSQFGTRTAALGVPKKRPPSGGLS
jgi:hypothetical protein